MDEGPRLAESARARPKEQALILLLHYSGLAILDAANLTRSALQSTGESSCAGPTAVSW